MKKKPIIRSLGSKWSKTKILMRSKDMSRYVPVTVKLNKGSLQKMLNLYKMVYVKPEFGTMGMGVIRVEKFAVRGKFAYRCQLGFQSHTFHQYDQLYRMIEKIKLKRGYLVQRGIHLLKFKQRPFDVRVMVQQSPAGRWETTGVIGRVAHPRKIVTNYHSGGTPFPMEVLLSAYMPTKQKAKFNGMLANLGHKIAVHFHRALPGFKEIGVDIGIDKHLKPWIIEVNSRPDPYIFNRLKNKSMYRKIYRYAKAYGRIK